MAISGYMLDADQNQVSEFNATVITRAGLNFGLALHPTSSRRAYIGMDSLKQIRSALGDKQFDKLLAKTKITVRGAVEEGDAKSLIESRDPADIGSRPNLEQPTQASPVDSEMLDWHLVETGICTAWQTLGGRDNIQWGDVAIGHIDTGFTAHPALGFKKHSSSSQWVDTGRDRNFFERELNPPEGNFPFAAYDSAEDDLGGFSGGHGTRTMSVLSAHDISASAQSHSTQGPGSYAGYFGAAPRVPVIPVRVENTIWIQTALVESLPSAIDYLVNEGVSVISLSMGSPKSPLATNSTPPALRAAIDNAYEKGVIFCCAAGNVVSKVVFPGRCPRTIAVGGSAPGGMPWMDSSCGPEVDISAPAFPIRRATTERGNKYTYGVGDGTSFATPLVAATAAMWLVHRRHEILQQYPEGWQRVAAFLDLLTRHASPGSGWNSSTHGAGILNAGAVLLAPLPDKARLQRDETSFE